jgi:flagellar biosynthetic protein FliR
MIIEFAQIEILLLIMARLMGVFFFAPVFNARSIAIPIKMAFVFWVSAVLWFIVPVQNLPESMAGLILQLFIEFLLGALIGFVCDLLFLAVQAAGSIIDLQMGLSVASILDPQTGTSTTIIGNLSFFIALVLFLLLNGHHLIVSALQRSFQVIPIGSYLTINQNYLSILQEVGVEFWVIAVQLCAPAVILIFFSDFCFGIVSRIAPQVNVFMLGFQVKPSIGMFGLLLTLPFLAGYFQGILGKMSEFVSKLLLILR